MKIQLMTQCADEAHWVTVHLDSWRRWTVEDSPCIRQLGLYLSRLKPCRAYTLQRPLSLRLQAVHRLAEAKAVALLIEALQDEELSVQEAACEALGQLAPEDEVALAALVVYESILVEAARVLREIDEGDTLPATREAVEILMGRGYWGALMHALPELWVREAVESLGEKAIPFLEEAADHIRPDVRRAAYRALAKIGGAKALAILTRALREDDSPTRVHISDALGSIGDPSVTPILLEILREPDSDERAAALAALAKLKDPAALPAIRDALNDESYWVRLTACQALGAYQDPSTVPALMSALEDGNEPVREAACKALGQIQDPAAIPALSQRLTDPYERWSVRHAACLALGAIADAAAIPTLTQALEDPSHSVRNAAREALAKIKEASDKSILQLG